MKGLVAKVNAQNCMNSNIQFFHYIMEDRIALTLRQLHATLGKIDRKRQ